MLSLLGVPTVTDGDVRATVPRQFPPRQVIYIVRFLAIAMYVPPTLPGRVFKGHHVPRSRIACLPSTPS
jgi:hypothetical protein